MTYKFTKVKCRAGLPYFGVKFALTWDEEQPYRGYLKALDKDYFEFDLKSTSKRDSA